MGSALGRLAGAAPPGKDENSGLYFFFGAGFLAAFLGILQAIVSSLGGNCTTQPASHVNVVCDSDSGTAPSGAAKKDSFGVS